MMPVYNKDSEAMRSFIKEAFKRGLAQEEVKEVIKEDVSISSNLDENVLKLSKFLRTKELVSLASDLESKFLAYKKAQNDLYSVTGETGEDVINFAHKEKNKSIPGLSGDSVFENLIEQQLKDMVVVNKQPTGKMGEEDVLDFVKCALEDTKKKIYKIAGFEEVRSQFDKLSSDISLLMSSIINDKDVASYQTGIINTFVGVEPAVSKDAKDVINVLADLSVKFTNQAISLYVVQALKSRLNYLKKSIELSDEVGSDKKKIWTDTINSFIERTKTLSTPEKANDNNKLLHSLINEYNLFIQKVVDSIGIIKSNHTIKDEKKKELLPWLASVKSVIENDKIELNKSITELSDNAKPAVIEDYKKDLMKNKEKFKMFENQYSSILNTVGA